MLLIRSQDLERDAATELGIVSGVDHAHRTTADDALNRIAADALACAQRRRRIGGVGILGDDRAKKPSGRLGDRVAAHLAIGEMLLDVCALARLEMAGGEGKQLGVIDTAHFPPTSRESIIW